MTAPRKPSAAPPPGFTAGEWREAKRLLIEPRHHGGASTVRMQNALVRKGFARIEEIECLTMCSLTPAGREAARRAR